ncbi:MAG: CDP-glycerol glycerophosphotransferase family protein [Senegalia sp. (in: firmicutes)]|uniref:CDP-glycerol glycerophosphotransferase family protein n=1 Tax=Bacillota TaxID=1239 RepID=UPI003F973EDE
MSTKIKRAPHARKIKLFEVCIGIPLKILPIKDIIIFESHSDFCDSSKALFNKIIEHNINEKFEIYWLVDDIEYFNDANLKNVKFISKKRNTIKEKMCSELRNIRLFSQCKYYFYTHNNFQRTKPKSKQVFFNLTHGTPLKNTKGKMGDTLKVTYILTPSQFSGGLMVKTYGGGESKLKVLGFPRNDFLLTKNDSISKLCTNENSYKKVIIWMPTFRRQKNSDRNDSSTNSKSDIPIISDAVGLSKLDLLLREKQVLLIIKPHPAQNMKYIKDINSSNIKIVTNKELLDKNIELYSLLGESDALITDYSSVYMDYLILDKPIGFTIDDLLQYNHKLGFMVEKPLDYMPGFKIKDIDDMLNFIEDVSMKKDLYKNERECICKLFNKYTDNNSSSRVLKFLGLIK